MALTLVTLGTISLLDDEGHRVRAPAQALVMLAFLLDVGHAVSRRDLAALLWPAPPRDIAATNLRSTIKRLLAALPAGTEALLVQDGGNLSVDRTLLTSDIDNLYAAQPTERLALACEAISLQFLPSYGAEDSPLDGWVRDVRARLLGHLRTECLSMSRLWLEPEQQSQLRRASMALLERDPTDDDIRALITGNAPAQPLRRAATPYFAHAITSGANAPGAITPDASVSQVIEQERTVAAERPASPIPRIALLPPESSDSAHHYGSVANALIEDLTIGLCASPTLSVVAPYTAERIQSSRDKADLLQKHGVTFALDTRRNGDMIFAQLIFMPTDEVIWAQRFPLEAETLGRHTRSLSEAVQGSIEESITTSAALADRFRRDPTVYYSYLRGLHSLSDLSLQSVRKARGQFKQSLRQDADFGPALAGMSRALTMEWLMCARDDRELITEARGFAERAVDAAPEFAGGFRELGVSQLYEGAIDDSLNSLEHAENISPHFADALYSHADSLVHAGDFELALQKINAAIELNPMAPDTYFWTAAGACYFLHQYSEAVDYIGRMRDATPATRLAAACWAMLGNPLKARLHRNRFLKDNPDFDVDLWLNLVPNGQRWQAEHYREGLKKAGF